MCKGSSAAGGEGLFFYNPPTAARFPNPSRRRLQACFAHSQIPCVKGAPPKAVRDCFFTTLPPLTRSPSPYTGEAHSNPSRRGLQACFAHSQIPPTAARFPNPSWRRLQACFAYLQIPLHKGAVIIPDNRSFFCLLFFSKKSTVPAFLFKEKYGY